MREVEESEENADNSGGVPFLKYLGKDVGRVMAEALTLGTLLVQLQNESNIADSLVRFQHPLAPPF